jgi:DNA-binding NarL/FixJ family response regulator
VIRVLLVDDQPLVREGLGRILRPQDGFGIVGEASDGAEALLRVKEAEPDVVLMDIRMRGMDGIEATRELRRQDGPPVLVLTTFDDDEVLAAALAAGAAGFILKEASADDIVQATHAVAGGAAWLDGAVAPRVLAAYRAERGATKTPEPPEGLSERELEVLRLMARGLNNQEISQELFISEATVKTHITHIFTKLDLRDRAAAIVYAFDRGLV